MPNMWIRSQIRKKGRYAGMPKLPSDEVPIVTCGDALRWIEKTRDDKTTPYPWKPILNELEVMVKSKVSMSPKVTVSGRGIAATFSMECPVCENNVDDECYFYPDGFFCVHCGQHLLFNEEEEIAKLDAQIPAEPDN